ncbi:hypothetical protein NEQG_01964 [Nematocida parisii ERTm3]|uniref:Uncharacterized protein n=1 Tax=Nematocida parisii (strain ERTm3) TaxID=935791 RepID=I3EF95_NEMP3|nr:hypothetical protein NEQG_01964 [Nematocida parisii ERTm3]
MNELRTENKKNKKIKYLIITIPHRHAVILLNQRHELLKYIFKLGVTSTYINKSRWI